MTIGKRRRTAPSAEIAERLRAAAKSLAPGDPLGTEVAIAAENGVTRMTARKAVNALVAEGLAERRAGVGVFVRGAGSVTRRWRFVAGNLLWDPAIKTASALRRAAAAVGAEVELRDAGGDEGALLAEIAALPESGAAGAILFSPHGPAFGMAVRALAARGFPAVVVDEDFGGSVNVSCVLSDNAMGGRLAAERLVRAGHSRLAFIGDFVADTVRARWEGFSKFAAASGAAKASRFDIGGGDRFGDWDDEVRAAARRLARRAERPTAVFCSCDAVARLAARALAECGVAVPRDVSLVGFDDDPIAEWTAPALTTVRQDFAAMGEAAVKALTARIANPSAPGRATVVAVEFVERESVKRLAGARTGNLKQGGRK